MGVKRAKPFSGGSGGRAPEAQQDLTSWAEQTEQRATGSRAALSTGSEQTEQYCGPTIPQRAVEPVPLSLGSCDRREDGGVGKTSGGTGEARRRARSFSTGSAGHQQGPFAGPELHGWAAALPDQLGGVDGPGGHLRSGGEAGAEPCCSPALLLLLYLVTDRRRPYLL